MIDNLEVIIEADNKLRENRYKQYKEKVEETKTHVEVVDNLKARQEHTQYVLDQMKSEFDNIQDDLPINIFDNIQDDVPRNLEENLNVFLTQE